MKNRIWTLSKIMLIVICILLLYGCTSKTEYTLSFDTNGGNPVEAIKTDGKSSIEMPPHPTKQGYVFLGWYWDNDTFQKLFSQVSFISKPITEDTTVYAAWLIDQFTISFNSNGGGLVDSISRDYNSTVIKPDDPQRLGYSFAGWYSDEEMTEPYTFSTMPAKDIIIYAKWEVNQYTINFDVDGGSEIEAITKDYLSLVSEPLIPTKTGHTFIGWFSDQNKTKTYQFTTMPAEDITIYAKWEINQYTITYDVDGGNEKAPSIIYYGARILRPTATKTGHTFMGWYSDPARTIRYIFDTMPAEDFTLYAKWDINQYQIKYHIVSMDYNGRTYMPLFVGEKIIQICLGDSHSAVVTSDGRIFTWGSNLYGKLGDGSNLSRDLPTDITGKFHRSWGEKITQISLGKNHSAALSSLGRIFTWGYNGYNNLGDGTTVNQNTPNDITEYINLNTDEKIIQIALGENHSSALTSEGRVFTWGFNTSGQLGDRTNNFRSYPTDITKNFDLKGEETISKIALGASHSSALSSNGRLFIWGRNFEYQLGDGTQLKRSTPFDITNRFDLVAGESITQVSLGNNHSSAITNNGRLFIWGSNSSGQLGDGTVTSKSEPIDITQNFKLNSGENITQVSLGDFYSSAITSTGQVFTWGGNNYGQLGNSFLTSKNLPNNITGGFSLSVGESIRNIALGSEHSGALTSSGRMFAWGENNYGSIGDNSNSSKKYPVLVRLHSFEEYKKEKLYYDELITEYQPELEGYTFSGWHQYYLFTSLYKFNKMPAQDLVLYGYWIKDN